MKTLEEIVKENGGTIVFREHKENDAIHDMESGYFIPKGKIESLINEVISQRAGEPVAYFWNDTRLPYMLYKQKFESIDGKEDLTPLYLAADPSVIDYVKTLRYLLENDHKALCDIANEFKVDLTKESTVINTALNNPPPSIKHLLT